MGDDLERRIAKRAHEIWQRDGMPNGRAADHWSEAQAQLESEVSKGAAELDHKFDEALNEDDPFDRAARQKTAAPGFIPSAD